MKSTDEIIEVSEVFSVSVEKVWKALTDLKEMKKWYFPNIDFFAPEIGSKSTFSVENEGRVFTHLWEVVEVIPHKKIRYTWKYLEWPGDSFVEFVLKETNTGIKATVRVTVLEDFPDNIPEFRRESCVGGWEYFVKGRLKDYLKS